MQKINYDALHYKNFIVNKGLKNILKSKSFPLLSDLFGPIKLCICLKNFIWILRDTYQHNFEGNCIHSFTGNALHKITTLISSFKLIGRRLFSFSILTTSPNQLHLLIA